MASTLVQFRVDDKEKMQAVQVCEKLGLNLQSYLKICMARLVQEQGIPFSMKIEYKEENRGIRAMKRASRIAEEYGISEMTLDEINTEIAEARKKGRQ